MELIFDTAQARVKGLGTYIDVLHIQRMGPVVIPNKIMKVLNDILKQGYIGASLLRSQRNLNFSPLRHHKPS